MAFQPVFKRGSSLAWSSTGLYRSSGFEEFKSYTETLSNTFEIASSGNPGYRTRMGEGDVGGGFYLKKREYKTTRGSHLDFGLFRGTVLYADPLGGPSPPAAPDYRDQGTLNFKGTHAVAQVLPTNPSAQLATFLGETATAALPYMPGAKLKELTKLARSSGDEWLNWNFGLLPAISDLKKFAYAVTHQEKILSQYVKDSGHKIKRRFAYPSVREQSSGASGFAHGKSNTLASGSVYYVLSEDIWFEGCFRYYLPVGDDAISRGRRFEALANKLLGVRITPEVIWNCSPWSWAADWVGNVGDVLHNVSALGSDGLAMQYGYIMSHQNLLRTYEVSGKTQYGDSVASSVVISDDVKQRLAANPYGFGIDWEGLSPKQLSILAALGITRGRAR